MHHLHDQLAASDTLLVIFLGHLRDQALQGVGERGRDLCGHHEWRHGRLHVLAHDGVVALIIKGHITHQRMKEHNTKAVDVGAVIDELNVHDLLRRHVVGRTHHLPCDRVALALHELGDAKVEQLNKPRGHARLIVQEDVRGLDVAVHDLELVSLAEHSGDLVEHLKGEGDGEAPTGEAIVERLTYEQLRDKKTAPIVMVIAKVIDNERVGVVQLRGDARLCNKAARKLLLLLTREREELHGHLSV